MFRVKHARARYWGGSGVRARAQGGSTRSIQIVGLASVMIISFLYVSLGYAQTAGEIKALEGTTELRAFDQTEFAPVTEGNPVQVGDVVETQQDSKCYIRLVDGSDNSLGELTSYNVNDIEESDGVILFNGWLDRGIARFRKKLPVTTPPSSYVITTPTAIIMVEPGEELTDFMVDILNQGQTYVAVLKGVITVKNISEDIPDEQKVRACQGAYIDQEQPPTKPHGVSTDEYQRLIDLTTIPGTLPEDVPVCEYPPDWIHYDCPCPPGFAEDPNTGECKPCTDCAYYDPETCTCNCCPPGLVWDAFLGGCTPICSSLTPVPQVVTPIPGMLPEEGCPCCECCPEDGIPPCYAASPGLGPNACPSPGPNQQVPCALCTNPGINVLPPEVSGLPCPICCECDAFGCGINLLPAPDNGPDFFGCGFPDGGWCISPGACAARAGVWVQRTFIPGWPCFMCIPNIPCWTLNPPLWKDGLTRMAQSKRLDPSDNPFPGFFFSARIRPAVAILMASAADSDGIVGLIGRDIGAAGLKVALDTGTKPAKAAAGKVVKACCSRAAKMPACPACQKPTYKKGKLECVPMGDGAPCFEGGVCKECKGGKCVDLPPCPSGKVRRVTTRPKSTPPLGGPTPDKSQVKALKGKAGKSRRAYLEYYCECVEVKEKCKTHQECRNELKNPNACCIEGECIVEDCPPGHRFDPDACRCIPPTPPPPPPSRCRSHVECKEILQNEYACCDQRRGKCFVKECPPGHRLDPETCTCIPPTPPPPSRCRSHHECKEFLQDENACCDRRTGRCFHKDCPRGSHLDPVTCRCSPVVPPCRTHSDCRRFKHTPCCDEASHQCRPRIRCPDGSLQCECRDEVCRSDSECMRKTRGRFPCCIDGKCRPKRKCHIGPPACQCKEDRCPPDNARKIQRCRSQRGTPELDRSGCFVRCKTHGEDRCPPDNARKIQRCRSQRGTPELDRSGCFVRCKTHGGDRCPPDNARKIQRCRSQRGTPELDRSGCFVRCKTHGEDRCPPDNARKIQRCRSQRGTPELDRSGCFVRCKTHGEDRCPPDNSRRISQCRSQRGTPEVDRRGCFVRCRKHGGESGQDPCAQCRARGMDCKQLGRGQVRCVPKGGSGSGGDPCAQCKARGMDCQQLGRGQVRCVPRIRR